MPRPDELDHGWTKRSGAPDYEERHDRYQDCHTEGMGAVGWLLLSVIIAMLGFATWIILPMVQDATDRPTACAGYATECAAAVVELDL